MKRYRKGTYAPASITWGYENRSVAIRVKALRGEHTHVENRLGCGACNPYLAFAGMIAAILDGIERRLDPPPPLEESAYGIDDLALLPSTLDEALERFEEDEILRGRFPPRVREGVPRAQAPRDREGAAARFPATGPAEWHDR